MILQLFENPLAFVFVALSMVVAITIHEAAHAKMADYLGDPTPRMQGRVTLNPLSHLDLYGTIFILLIGFGWGKPVQFDPFNLRNRRRDSALISIVGPLSNFAIALAASLILNLLQLNSSFTSLLFVSFLSVLIQLNIMLGIFNLIPIHPLDGFKIVEGILSSEQAYEWRKLERFGFIFLLLLIIPIGEKSVLQTVFTPIISFVVSLLVP